MSPRRVVALVRRDVPVLAHDTTVDTAVRALLDSDLPALPVADARGRYAGIFGEREFIGALFPRYVQSLGYAGFVPQSMEAVLDKRRGALLEPVMTYVNSEHVDVSEDVSDIALAETFLHHRVLVIPITQDGHVRGLVTRADFFTQLAGRLLDEGSG
jgi:CBS domain-containing protein